MDQLYTYENSTLDVYSRKSVNDSLTTSLKIVSDIENEKIGNDFCLIPLTVNNPFEKMRYWIKQEIHDFEAMIKSIEGIDKLLKDKEKLIAKICSAQKEMQNLEEGKKSFKTLFQSQTGRHNKISELNTYISRSEVIVETYDKVLNLLTVYMWMKEISQFKLWKASNYYKCLSTFCTEELEGNNHIMNLWENLKYIMERKEKIWQDDKAKEQYEREVKLKLDHRNELGEHEHEKEEIDHSLNNANDVDQNPKNQENQLYAYDPQGKDSFLHKDYDPDAGEAQDYHKDENNDDVSIRHNRDPKVLAKSSVIEGKNN